MVEERMAERMRLTRTMKRTAREAEEEVAHSMDPDGGSSNGDDEEEGGGWSGHVNQ